MLLQIDQPIRDNVALVGSTEISQSQLKSHTCFESKRHLTTGTFKSET